MVLKKCSHMHSLL